jgi:hypothetical protein
VPVTDTLDGDASCAIALLVIAALTATMAFWAAIAFGREYGIESFWGTIAWGTLFALVPLVPGILLIRRFEIKDALSPQQLGCRRR